MYNVPNICNTLNIYIIKTVARGLAGFASFVLFPAWENAVLWHKSLESSARAARRYLCVQICCSNLLELTRRGQQPSKTLLGPPPMFENAARAPSKPPVALENVGRARSEPPAAIESAAWARSELPIALENVARSRQPRSKALLGLPRSCQ